MEDIEDIASSVMDAVEMGLVVDQWVAVRFENYWYPGQITKVYINILKFQQTIQIDQLVC